MIVKIHLQYGAAAVRIRGLNRNLALVAATLLTPLSLTAWVLGFWRLGADLRWTEDFFIAQGLLSRWQVWMAVAIAIQVAAMVLQRYGRKDEIAPDTRVITP